MSPPRRLIVVIKIVPLGRRISFTRRWYREKPLLVRVPLVVLGWSWRVPVIPVTKLR